MPPLGTLSAGHICRHCSWLPITVGRAGVLPPLPHVCDGLGAGEAQFWTQKKRHLKDPVPLPENTFKGIFKNLIKEINLCYCYEKLVSWPLNHIHELFCINSNWLNAAFKKVLVFEVIFLLIMGTFCWCFVSKWAVYKWLYFILLYFIFGDRFSCSQD